MLSRTLEHTIHRALSLAHDAAHANATLEHLLLALIDDADAAPVLLACGVDFVRLRADLAQRLDRETVARGIPGKIGDPHPTAGLQNVIQRAATAASMLGRGQVTGADVLSALMREKAGEVAAVGFLAAQGCDRVTVGAAIAGGDASDAPAT